MKSIFVSSTFRDMNYERDILRYMVLPEINEMAKQYGDSVSLCDLRWGIDTSDMTEEEADKSVLSVCMDEIDRTYPYMIVLLGSRYGHIPGEELMRDATKQHHFSVEDYDISVTQLEIEYSIYKSRNANANIIFYVRNLEGVDIPREYLPESDSHRRKMEHLLARIREQKNYTIREYTANWDGSGISGLEEFAKSVASDLKAEFLPAWKEFESESLMERTKRAISLYNQGFLANTIQMDYYMGYISKMKQRKGSVDGEPYPAYVFTGGDGEGKTHVIRSIAAEMRRAGYETIEVYCGFSKVLSTVKGVLLYSLYQMEEIVGVEHRFSYEDNEEDIYPEISVDEIIDYFNGIISEYTKEGLLKGINKKRVLIAIDGVELLEPDIYLARKNFYPESLSPFVQVIYTTNRNENGWPLFEWKKEHIPALVDNSLLTFGKQLSKAVRQRLYTHEMNVNPLYIYMAIARLTIMNVSDYTDTNIAIEGMEAINERQIQIIDALPGTIEEMSQELMLAISRSLAHDSLQYCFEFISISRMGLRIEDLKGICALCGEFFLPVRFVQAINFFNDLFILRDNGRYDFAHLCIRKGVQNSFSQHEHLHDVIIDYMESSLKLEDDFRTTDYIYHMLRSSRLVRLSDFYVPEDIRTADRRVIANDIYIWCLENEGRRLQIILKHSISVNDDNVFGAIRFICKYVLPCFGQTNQEETVAYALIHSICDHIERNEKIYSDSEKAELWLFLAKKMLTFRNRAAFVESYELARRAMRMGESYVSNEGLLVIGKISALIDVDSINAENDCLHETLWERVLENKDGIKDTLYYSMLIECGLYQQNKKNNDSNQKAIDQLTRAYMALKTDRDVRYNSERDYEFIELLNALGDAFSLGKDKKNTEEAGQYYEKALEAAIRRRGRDKSLKGYACYIESYKRMATYNYKKSKSLSFFDYLKRDNAIIDMRSCWNMLQRLNKQLCTGYSEYATQLSKLEYAIYESEFWSKSLGKDVGEAVIKTLESVIFVLRKSDDYPFQKFYVANAMYNCANLIMKVRGEHGSKSAIDYYNAAIELTNQKSGSGTAENYDLLVVKCKQGIVNILSDIGGGDNIKLAAEIADGNIRQFRQIVSIYRNADMIHALAEYIWTLGNLLDAIGYGEGDINKLVSAKDCFEEVIVLRRELSKMSAKTYVNSLRLAEFHLYRINRTIKRGM